MTTKLKRQGSTELPRFVVGALATAGASAANGAIVQFTFGNNVVSLADGQTYFSPDLTGDGVNDVMGASWTSNGSVVGVYVSGSHSLGSAGLFKLVPWAAVGGISASELSGVTLRGLVAVTFSDSRIGDGVGGWLDIEATSGVSIGDKEVRIHRLIFDDESTSAPTGVAYTDAAYPEFVAAVPEPGSNLALLALGAGGLTLRRRLKRAA